MREEWTVEHRKALELTSSLGCRVKVTAGDHQGKEGILISITQPELRHPMCDSPDDPPSPYATVDWWDETAQRFVKDFHYVTEVELVKLKPLI